MIFRVKVSGNPRKTWVIVDWPTPKIMEKQSYLGVVIYYRGIFFHNSGTAKPLTRLKGNIQFQRGLSADETFNKLKVARTTAPTQASFNPQEKIFCNE